jgi:hypothetical protein
VGSRYLQGEELVMRFSISSSRAARAALTLAVVLLPLKAGGCAGSSACINVPQATYEAKGCPSRSDANTFFASSCAVQSVDGEGSYDGEFCCYPVTNTGNGVDCAGVPGGFGGGIGATTGVSGNGGSSGTGGVSGGSGFGITTADCTCACVTLMSAGGCADLCDAAQNGTDTPNWCNGAAALSQCAACLAVKCAIDPTEDAAQTACM